MKTVNLYDAKTRLSELVTAAERGEEIVIARNGKPVARLVAFTEKRRSSNFGLDRGVVTMAHDFDAPLDDFGPYKE